MTEPSALELAEAGLRHAEGLTAKLSLPDWRPGRSHVEQARNSISKLAAALRAAPAQGEPAAWTNEAQLIYLKDPEYAAMPMAMWAKPHGAQRIPLYAAPVPPADLAEECAKIAEGHVGACSGPRYGPLQRSAYDEACRDIAKAIRDTYAHE